MYLAALTGMGHDTTKTTNTAGGSAERRRAATEQHERAINAINAVFDRVAEMSRVRARLAGLAASAAGDDPLRDVEALLQASEQLGSALAGVRAAATAATEHRSRGEQAADVGTRLTLLFPRSVATPRPRPDARTGRSSAAAEGFGSLGPGTDETA